MLKLILLDENQRLLNRKLDREKRREIRFQEYLWQEYKHMCYEDNRYANITYNISLVVLP